MTIDLVGVEDVQKRSSGRNGELGKNDGPFRRDGVPVLDREYMLYAKIVWSMAGL